MATFEELYSEMLNKSYYERVTMGKNCSEKVLYHIGRENDYDPDGLEAKAMLILMLRDVIGADGSFDEDEYDYLCEILEVGMDYDVILESMNDLDDGTRRWYKRFIAQAPQDIRYAFVALAILVCGSDGRISHEEHREIKKYL